MALDALRKITQATRWRAVAESVTLREEPLPGSTSDFGTYWIEAGHRIREQIADDQLLCTLLWRVLPRYLGGPVTLYRGENLGRWRAGQLGLAWTQDIEVARMFGRGLNAINSGGVLLQCNFVPATIISGPNKHSSYLQEEQFTIDPFLVQGLREIEEYPPL